MFAVMQAHYGFGPQISGLSNYSGKGEKVAFFIQGVIPGRRPPSFISFLRRFRASSALR
jgi:hypothetical protein